MLVRPIPQRGFTLIELMTTISVLAILTMVALPAYRDFIANQRVRNASYQLTAALTQARSQAITQNCSIDLKSAGGTSHWDSGWAVAANTVASSGACASAQTFVQQESMQNLSIASSLDTITYGRDGRATTGATQFTIKPDPELSGVKIRCISIGLSGMPTSKEGACS